MSRRFAQARWSAPRTDPGLLQRDARLGAVGVVHDRRRDRVAVAQALHDRQTQSEAGAAFALGERDVQRRAQRVVDRMAVGDDSREPPASPPAVEPESPAPAAPVPAHRQ